MTAKLKTILRDNVGSRHARRLRLQGQIPISLQGDGEHVNASIDQVEFLTARRHHEHVFELALPSKGEAAMVRELQWDALGETILHVEFHRVDLLKATEAEVGLEFAGRPTGGVLNHLVTHVTVSAIPSKIPDKIEVNVETLEPGHPLLASDIVLPEGVELAMEPDTQVAVVTVRVEVEETPAEEEEGVEAVPETPAPEDEDS